MRRKEADVQRPIAERLVKLHSHRNWLLEVKIKGAKQKTHQKVAQHQVEKGNFLWKPPDMGQKNPGDYIFLGDADYLLCTADGRNVVCDVNGGV